MLLGLSINWSPYLPGGWIALVTVGLVALLIHGSIVLARKRVPGRWIGILCGLRLAVIALFVLIMLQPSLTYTRETKPKPEMRVLIDVSPSMSLPASEAPSRLEEAKQRLSEGDLFNHLRDNYQLTWAAFDRVSRSVEGVSELQANGPTTNFAASLSSLAGRPERVLLVSDGHDHGSGDPAEAARRIGVVIDGLPPSSPRETSPTRDIVIDQVQAARRVLLGSDTHLRITFRSEQAASIDRPVQLKVTENGETIRDQSVPFPKGATEHRVTLAWRPATAGVNQYEFRIGDQVHKVQVQAVDRKNEVLILEDSWRWEFKFLRRVIEDDPSLRYTATLARDGGAFQQFGSPERRVKLVGFPQSRADLDGFDTILLGDVNPARWPRGLATAIADLVREEGKSLAVIAGPNLIHLAEVPELHALLPVELTRDVANPLNGPVEVRVTPEGMKTPFFESPIGEKANVVRLPALDQIYPPLRKRPAATVLLEAVKTANAYGNLIVMAEQPVGRGRVLFVGTDTLWKWQTLAPVNEQRTTPYSTFWQQALRALTPVRLAQDGVQFWVTPSRSRVESGGSVSLRAEVRSEQPLPGATVQASVILPGERRVPIVFSTDPKEPEVFRAEIATPITGSYSIQANLLKDGRPIAEATTAIEVGDASSELLERAVNRAALERIVQATGGNMIDPNNRETWPTPNTDRPAVLATRTLHLWNNWVLLLVLMGVLGIDWFLRLVRGFV